MCSSSKKIVERRRFQAPCEAVFEAFADASLLTRWLSPADEIATEVLEFDFRPGGRFRLGFASPTGHHGLAGGEYREIDRPHRLVFSWTWEPPDPQAGIETLVTVLFVEDQRGTELVLTHEQFPDTAMCSRHRTGWHGALNRLNNLLANDWEKSA